MKGVAIFAMMLGVRMKILFIISVKILFLLMWSYRSPLKVSTIKHNSKQILSTYSCIFWTHDVLLVSVLRTTPKHTPLKYGRPIKIHNQISPRILCTGSEKFGILRLHLSGMYVRQTWLLRVESIPWSSFMSCKYLSFKSCNWNLGTINESVILLYEHGQLL